MSKNINVYLVFSVFLFICSFNQFSVAQEANDINYLEQPFTNFMLSGMKFTSTAAYTNQTTESGGAGIVIPARLDSAKTVYQASIGWSGKHIIRDLMFLGNGQGGMDYYRGLKKGNKLEPMRWALIDAITMDAKVSYGETLADPQGKNNFTTSEQFGYTIGIKYEISLDNIGTKWKE